MNFRRLSIFLGLVLLPGIVDAQQAAQPAAPAPKLVAALGWDVATQGGFTTSVVADAQNQVWVGTEGNGVWCYDPHAKKWTQYTSKDGLGDDYIYALAVDKMGRVWVGHLNHGVSVWNGQKWQNYGIVDGPLGSRVFAITTCPTDGDVWIATECGAARYSIADDDWDYFTRASGLPSNQIQSIAFDSKGNIYMGTQCDGIAMADAKDKYTKWAVAPGVAQLPNAPAGAGLGSSLINDVTVASMPQNAAMPGQMELVVAATPVGISISGDAGDHFNFARGEDWQDNVKGLLNVPDAPVPQPGGIFRRGIPMPMGGVMINGNARGMIMAARAMQAGMLPEEDWVTCLHQEKDTGRLWIGYRQKGLEIRNIGMGQSIRFDTEGLDTLLVRSIWTSPKTPAFIAVYDEKNGGLKTPSDSTAGLDPGDPAPKEAPALPSPAKAPTAEDIEPLTKRLDFFKNELQPGDAVFIGDDWGTGGDWVGHYGTSYAMLYIPERALMGLRPNPGDSPFVPYEGEAGFSSSVAIGPHYKNREDQTQTIQSVDAKQNPLTKNISYDPFYHSANRLTDNPRVLYSPFMGRRSEGEINDRSFDLENYPFTWEGPDLLVTVEVPKGIHTLSLYFQNYDGQEGSQNKLRDYDIEVLPAADTQDLTLKGTPLARARVVDFVGGVYKQFAIAGPAKYVVHIKRNRSYATKIMGLFIDRSVVDPSIEKKPIPGFDKVKYAAPEEPDDLDTDDNPALSAATDLWDELVDTVGKRGAIPLEAPLGIWAYRAAVASKAPAALLASWRWQLCIWTQEDRDAFDKAMADAYTAYSGKPPPAKPDKK